MVKNILWISFWIAVFGAAPNLLLFHSCLAESMDWIRECHGVSCSAVSGNLEIFWKEDWKKRGQARYQLTGVVGLPLNLDEFATKEKKIDRIVERAISETERKSIEVKTPFAESFFGIGHLESADNTFSEKEQYQQDKSQGSNLTIDYMLAFVKWYGDKYVKDFDDYTEDKMPLYAKAMEEILVAYNQGTLKTLIPNFIFDRGDVTRFDKMPIDAKVTTTESLRFLLIKYISLTDFSEIADLQTRYVKASARYDSLTNSEYSKLTGQYKADRTKLAILCEGNQTSKKLYDDGQKELAFIKWLGDSDLYKSYRLKDRYIVALHDNGVKSLYYTDFTTAIHANDLSVNQITFKPIEEETAIEKTSKLQNFQQIKNDDTILYFAIIVLLLVVIKLIGYVIKLKKTQRS